MSKKYFRGPYGSAASITERRDGTATLIMSGPGWKKRIECKSATSAKRTFSRACGGGEFVHEVIPS